VLGKAGLNSTKFVCFPLESGHRSKTSARPSLTQTVEHPFGTIKSWMGATHFQMKTLKHVSTEMALHVLAYNMKRLMRILGVAGLMEAIRA
jgi:hypothetical protein